MTVRDLILRSLRFHWRSHLGVFLGAALATAILVGALAVGDSVRYSLRTMALNRIGEIRLALNGKGRFFRAELGKSLGTDLNTLAVPTILVRGTAASDTGESRAPNIQVVGVSHSFWKLSPSGSPQETGPDGVILNTRLAERLQAKPGQEVVLRVDKPSILSRDAPLSTTEDSVVALRLPVRSIVEDADFGRFSLEANQIPPFTAFVPLELLQKELEMEGRANILLVGGKEGAEPTFEAASTSLLKHWDLADASLEIRDLKQPAELELRTDRVFIDTPVSQAALGTSQVESRGVLSYFVNELRSNGRATPYSLVTAMDGGVVPAGMAEDEIILNQWQAEDLGAKIGDRVELRYYVVGPKRRLEERSRSFRVREILPMAVAARDRSLMPAFPGVADADNCRDWKPGIPINLDRIRDKDEVYWDAYRGTPKAFISLKAGQKIWNNRFGDVTAVRYSHASTTREAVEAGLKQSLTPAGIGLVFVPVREYALAASGQALDFGQLFLGFSFFLIVAALLLTALLFGLGAEQRAEEMGILLALGFTAARVRRMMLAEGAVIALLAGLVGTFAGVFYTQAVIRGLTTVWSGAVAQSALLFHAEPATLATGAVIGFLVSLGSIWMVTRRQARLSARELLSAGGEGTAAPTAVRRRWKVPVVPLAGAAALAMLFLAFVADHSAAAGYFFGAGAALLICGVALCGAYLGRLEREAAGADLTLGSLGVRNTTRRRNRSLSAITLLACGTFLVIAVGASRHDPNEGAEKRSSGTGGFAFYAESSLPVYHDLNTREGRDVFGLDDEELQGVGVVQMRLREGDEASCLNLNRAQSPRILGVNPEELAGLKAFTFAGTLQKTDGPDQAWRLLDTPAGEPDTIHAIGDANTVMWGLGKKLGDSLVYVDERGKQFKVKLVGMVAPSVLQGSLLISESAFQDRFPSQAGYQVFLIDAPKASAAAVSDTLGRALEDTGLDINSAPERLAMFNTVENTYLSIFAVLGGLGLLLGTLGLGIIVLRNVLERRGELGLLRAVGFTGGKLQWMVFSEHSLLLGLGLLVGVVSALVAVLPALRSPGAEVPCGSLAVILAAVLISGFLWVWGATAASLRGPLMRALRNE